MRRRLAAQRGFTLVELLVTVGILSIVSVGFYTVLFSGVRGSNTARSIAGITQEARQGINRMLRDTREASQVNVATATSYQVHVDFDGDGFAPNPASSPNPQGDFELLTFTYDSSASAIRLNGEILVRGVEPVAGQPIFSYGSNLLEHDADDNGITTLEELDLAAGNGASLSANLLIYVSEVRYSFQVRGGAQISEFSSQAQLRNRR